MKQYSVHINDTSSLPCWEVFYGSEWLGTFGRKTDAELFAKFKQINDILST